LFARKKYPLLPEKTLDLPPAAGVYVRRWDKFIAVVAVAGSPSPLRKAKRLHCDSPKRLETLENSTKAQH
jgi:hypothetical protein